MILVPKLGATAAHAEWSRDELFLPGADERFMNKVSLVVILSYLLGDIAIGNKSNEDKVIRFTYKVVGKQ